MEFRGNHLKYRKDIDACSVIVIYHFYHYSDLVALDYTSR